MYILFLFGIYKYIFLYKFYILGSYIIIHKVITNIIIKNIIFIWKYDKIG
jgi:hypothetical protein